jgi:hypothetical protein
MIGDQLRLADTERVVPLARHAALATPRGELGPARGPGSRDRRLPPRRRARRALPAGPAGDRLRGVAQPQRRPLAAAADAADARLGARHCRGHGHPPRGDRAARRRGGAAHLRPAPPALTERSALTAAPALCGVRACARLVDSGSGDARQTRPAARGGHLALAALLDQPEPRASTARTCALRRHDRQRRLCRSVPMSSGLHARSIPARTPRSDRDAGACPELCLPATAGGSSSRAETAQLVARAALFAARLRVPVRRRRSGLECPV